MPLLSQARHGLLRRDELLDAVIDTPDFQARLASTGQPTRAEHIVSQGISGGERVLKVILYHRDDGESRIFRYAPELGEFLVPEIMLRAGAGSTKLSLEDVPGVRTVVHRLKCSCHSHSMRL